MKLIIRGTRPRPRVGLVGNYSQEEIDQFEHLFPKVRQFPTMNHLEMEVEVEELDLIVIGQDTSKNSTPRSNYYRYVHVISFSPNVTLPGPTDNVMVGIYHTSKHEEFVLPNLKLSFNQRRETDLRNVDNIRDWSQLHIHAPGGPQEPYMDEINRAGEIIKNGSIMIDRNDDISLAAIYKREGNNLGIAFLPNPVFDQVKWVELIATEWAQEDSECFPDFGDWTKLSEWMVLEEEEIIERIKILEIEKQEIKESLDQEIANLQSDLSSARLNANRGLRGLITSQSDELVSEVVKVFQGFGFEVEEIDETIDPSSPKREDLRLRDPSADSDWEAIAEVRGYLKSAGKTADFQRLSRFSTLYLNEKGRMPDKRIYVVNGQIELGPGQRQEILASAEEDIRVFGENEGIVISTLDLFRAMKAIDQIGKDRIMESIKNAVGRWNIKSVEDQN